SGSVGVWVVALDKLYGWEYFEKLAENAPQVGRSVVDGLNLVESGERSISTAPLVLVEAGKKEGKPLMAVYPEDGALLPASVSAVMEKAPHPNAARLFMEFMLSKDYS